MRKLLPLTLLLCTIFTFSSCKLFNRGVEANGKAIRNADSLVTGLINTRSKVYQQVRAIKNDSVHINKDTLAALRKQYEGVASGFNGIYKKVENSVDSTKWNQAKCILFKYKRVLAPYETDFTKAANQADLFNAKALVATGQSGNIITSVIPFIMPLLKSIAKERLQLCKRDIERLNYDTWDKIAKTN